MGCICSKASQANKYFYKNVNKKELQSNSLRQIAVSLGKEETVVEAGGSDMTRLMSDLATIPANEWGKNVAAIEKPIKQPPQRQPTMENWGGGGQIQVRVSGIAGMPNGEKGAQVVAGWPSWLTAVAGEAINGWVPRRADSFEKLDKIGQGTYSSVYRARDLETNKIVALKKVRFANMDPESVRFMAREIIILRRLNHPNVMKLEGLITSRVSGSLYLVFEYMDHDLAGLAAFPGVKFTEAQIKCYMQQLLRGLEHCHNNGVVHRDIKGSNLLIDNRGNLKIADFGLATFFCQKQPLTSRVVTLWYRPPELLLGATEYGSAVDLWSTGCILAEFFVGKPILPGRTEVEQMHKIFKLCGSPSEEYWKKSKLLHATSFKPQRPYKRCVSETYKDFPSYALALLDVFLAIEPECRGTASSALQSEFFMTEPLPCDPSKCPKYQPSKEFDVKLRDEETRRRKAAGQKGCAPESIQRSSRESKARPTDDINVEWQALIKKSQRQSNPKSTSEKCNPRLDHSGFPIELSKGPALNDLSHSGRLMQPGALGSSLNDLSHSGRLMQPGALGSSLIMKGGDALTGPSQPSQKSCILSGAAELSRFSNSVANRGSSRCGISSEASINLHWPEERFNARYNHLDASGGSSETHEWSHHLLDPSKSLYKKGEWPSSGKGSIMGFPKKSRRIHYSGPLMPPGGNLVEMLREHEKQIQHAVRKARLDSVKAK